MFNKGLVVLLLSMSVGYVLAKPYWYFQEAGEAVPKTPSEVAATVQQAAGQAHSSATGADKASHPGISSHLGELYTHGSTAIKGVADTVNPDLKNIGQDVAEAFHSARERVRSNIEPLAQTVRPYIEHAHKAVTPYVNQAKEEVPKALGKVQEQVHAAWDKLTSAVNPAPASTSASSATQKVQETGEHIKQTGQQIQQTTTNAVQQAGQAASQATTTTTSS